MGHYKLSTTKICSPNARETQSWLMGKLYANKEAPKPSKDKT